MVATENSSSRPSFQWWWYALVLLAIAISLRIRLASVGEPGDDAYITLRHVKNIVAGNGYVYNEGVPMLGTSTALYPLLLSLICYVSGLDAVAGGVPLYVVSEIVALILLAFIASVCLQNAALGALVSLVFALSRYSANAAMIHMEAPLFVALLLIPPAAILAGDSRRLRTAAALGAGLATVCRPEGVLMMAALAAYLFVRDRRIPLRECLWMAAPPAVWVAFAFYYFGSPIPQSVKAKAVGYLSNPDQALVELKFHFSQLFTGTDSAAMSSSTLGVVIGLPLFVWGSMLLVRRDPRTVILLGFTYLFLLFYLLGNPFIFIWYLPPIEPGYIIAVFAGAAWLIEAVLRRAGREIPASRVQAGAAVLLIMCLLNRYNFYGPLGVAALDRDRPWLTYRHSGKPPIANLRYQREGYYKLAAEDLAPYVSAKTMVLAPEFGAFGYFSEASIVSSVGHVNPEALPYLPPLPEETALPEANHSVPKRMAKALRADYVLSLECFIRKSLLVDPWFLSEYRLWKHYPGATTFGSKGLYIFQRKDLPPPPWGEQTVQPDVTAP